MRTMVSPHAGPEVAVLDSSLRDLMADAQQGWGHEQGALVARLVQSRLEGVTIVSGENHTLGNGMASQAVPPMWMKKEFS